MTLSVSHIVAKLYIVFFKLITKIYYNTDSRQITLGHLTFYDAFKHILEVFLENL